MINNGPIYDFPPQRVSDAEKEKVEWYANCIDWIIQQGVSYRDEESLIKKYQVLQGKIPDTAYHKVLNPYNFKNEAYKRYPADIRNYDLITGIVRRYVSEYTQGPHEFIVGANNPEVILAKNAKLRKELKAIVEQQLAAEIQKMYAEYMQQGGDPQQFNPQEQIDIEAYIKDFNEKYIDDISAQGSDLLQVIKDITEDSLFYAVEYFNFVTFGECYSYADVVGEKLVKRYIAPIDAFPIPNDNIFVEDFDAFAERRQMTYQQIIDEFDEYLSPNDRKFLETYYAKSAINGTYRDLAFSTYKTYFPNICNKFSQRELELFEKSSNIMPYDVNSGLFEVWHVTWRGERKQSIVTFVNQLGMIEQRVELGDYELNPEAGDIDIEYVYVPQVYEGVRIGTRQNAIYPYKSRAIAYNREGKLPYNGIMELLPGMGKFSIVEIITPFQMFYNIIAFEREMAVVKNKVSLLILAKSLLGKVPDEVIHKMLADGVLYVDDSDDQGALRMQQIRFINTSYGDWIKQLTELMADVKQTAMEQVDMTPQRYGEIANSAGKGVTEEAIIRGSMGSVIVEFMMDTMRERDYARDMDFSKLAWIDGLDTSFRQDDELKYISLNVDNHVYADYCIKAKNSAKLKEKLQQIKQFAFSAAQNGDSQMAIAAITGDNIEKIKTLIAKFETQKQENAERLKQIDQQIMQMEQEFEIQKIQVKGEEDRKTEYLKGLLDKEIELAKADANMVSYDNGVSDTAKNAAVERLNSERAEVDRQRVNLERQKMFLDFASKAEDRRLKEKDIDTKLKIAKTNKNRYDK